jgi:hypothetical protein
MVRVMVLLALVTSWGLAGCGSDGVSAEQARADCTSLFTDILCPKVTSCDPTTTQADCLAQVQSMADCSKVTGENGELMTCETQLQASTCAVFYAGGSVATITSPASCRAVFISPTR